MERTDKQENMCGGENRQVFSAACQSGFYTEREWKYSLKA